MVKILLDKLGAEINVKNDKGAVFEIIIRERG